LKNIKLLGIDYGEKNIGIAFADTNYNIVIPITNLKSSNKTVFLEICNIIKEKKIDKIIVGLPLNKDATESKICGKIKKFVIMLNSFIDIPVEFIDETMTTKEIEAELINLKVSYKKRKEKIDQLSACLILENYINKIKYEIK